MLLNFAALVQQAFTLLLQVLDLRLALGQQQLQIGQAQLGCLTPSKGLGRRRALTRLVLDRRHPFAFCDQHLTYSRRTCVCDTSSADK